MEARYFTDETLVKELRRRRSLECFPIVNRGKLWYDLLTMEQEAELKQWYEDWLNVTETKVIPVRPRWFDDKLVQGGDIL